MSFGGGGGPSVQPVAQAPSRSDEEIRKAALEERLRQSKARGRASTIRTSGQGVTDEVAPAVKQLLGA